MLVNPRGPFIDVTTGMPSAPSARHHRKRLAIRTRHRLEGRIGMAHQRLPDHFQTMAEMAVDGGVSAAVRDSILKH